MEITLDKHTENQASVKITLNEADYQPKVDAKLKDYAKKANIKGFRPGKAPVGIVKKMYGTSVLVEEINTILSEELNTYLKAQSFRILGEPLPEIEDADAIDWKNQKTFDFTYRIGFVEDVQVQVDASLNATRYEIELDEKTIQETITNLREQNGEKIDAEASAEGDSLKGVLKSVNGEFEEEVSFELSAVNEKSLKKFVGLKVGDIVEFDPSKAISENLAETFQVSEEDVTKLAGPCTLIVEKISRTQPVELNQEFFDRAFGPGVVSNEEEFEAKVKELLAENYNRELRVFSDEELKKTLLAQANIQLPEEFLKEWLIRSNEGKVSTEEVEREYPAYARQLSWSLISNAIAKANDIQATHEEVLARTRDMIREQLGMYGMSEQIEQHMDTFVDNYLKEKEGNNYMQMLTSIQNDKVLDFVREKSEAATEVVTVEKFKSMLEN
ncbi:MAG: trigger factor [Nitritalea sp.]